MREAKVEKYLKQKTEQLGALCLKCTSPGTNGMPDRIVLWKSKIWFIELKAPGKKPRKLQEYIHEEIRSQGFQVRVMDCLEDVEEFIHEICTT